MQAASLPWCPRPCRICPPPSALQNHLLSRSLPSSAPATPATLSFENGKLMSTSCLLGLLPFPPGTGLQASDGQDGSTDRPVLQRHLHSSNPICSSRETVDPVLICFTTWLGLFTYLVAVCPLMRQWTPHKVGTFSILSIALLLAPRKILGVHKLVFIESMHDSPQIVCLAVYMHVYSPPSPPPPGESP